MSAPKKTIDPLILIACILVPAGFLVMDIVSETLGIVILLGVAFFFLAYLVAPRDVVIAREEKVVQPTQGTQIGSWGLFFYPWSLSVAVNVGINYALVERTSPDFVIWGQFGIALILHYFLLRRLVPELMKLDVRFLAIMLLFPMSSVGAAFVVWIMLLYI